MELKKYKYWLLNIDFLLCSFLNSFMPSNCLCHKYLEIERCKSNQILQFFIRN